jgi:hypothetical protein
VHRKIQIEREDLKSRNQK